MVKITVDGVELEVDPNKPLIHACHSQGVDVPMYCYHPGLSPVGSCRICQVEVQQGDAPPRVVVACRQPVAEGMVVTTQSEKAKSTRRECLEFLLKNHPLDCPICDKAGECDLQDFAFAHEQGEGRSSEPRRKLEKRKSLGDVIVLDQERCILCSRCVRFMEEVPKTPQLTVAGLGSRSVISTFADRPLAGNYQGNLADVCPVGALTLDKFRFQARVWNLRKSASTCSECSRGCATWVDVLRGQDVKRFRPRPDESVNDWWMCDTGRFALERHAREDRLAGAAVREAGGLVRASTEEGLDRAADALSAGSKRAVVVSPFVTQEEARALQGLAEALDAELCFVSPADNGLGDDLLHTGDPCPNRKGLEQLGIAGQGADELVPGLGEYDAVLLAGERVAELCGLDALDALQNVRLVALDEVALFAPAARASIGVATHVEKLGTWINVDGLERGLGVARSAPPDTRGLERLCEGLLERLAPALVGGGADASGGEEEQA